MRLTRLNFDQDTLPVRFSGQSCYDILTATLAEIELLFRKTRP